MTSRAAAFKLLLSRRAPLALSLDFTSGVLDPRITFSRGTLGTRVDSTGKITYGPNNIAVWSTDPTNAQWGAAGVSKTGGFPDPFGGTSAVLITANGASSTHYVTSGAASYKAGVNYVLSVYVQAGTANRVQLAGDGGTFAATAYANFLLSGSGSVSQTGAAVTGTTITALPNGWYRISIAVPAAGTSADWFAIGPLVTGSETALPTTTSTGTFVVIGGQAEAVTYQTTPGTYNPTTGAAYYGPRFGYDPVRLNALGLLVEEARTNLIVQSGTTSDAGWVAQAAAKTSTNNVAPDGTNTAALVTANGASAQHYIQNSAVTLTSGTQYAFTLFVKAGSSSLFQLAGNGTNFTGGTFYANFSLTGSGSVTANGAGALSPAIQAFPGGWYRVSFVATPNVTGSGFGVVGAFITGATDTWVPTNTSAATIQVWGAQVEATTTNYPGPTSYMPTGAAAVTRNADLASMTGSNFSSWFNPAAGTFVTTVTPPGDYNQLGLVLHANDNSTSNVHRIGRNDGTFTTAGKTWAGSTVATTVQSAIATTGSSGSTVHLAYTYALNDFALSADGGTVGTDASGTLPIGINQIGIGSYSPSPQQFLNGHIAALDYYNIRQSNAQMNILTAWLPSLSLDFTSGVLDPRITFTRASIGTFVGSNGLIQTASSGAPRFGYDPVTLLPLGLLIEEARTNLTTQSDNTANAGWGPNNAAKTSTNNSDPGGTTTAALFTSNGAATIHYVTLPADTLVSATVYARSVFVKAGTATIVQLASTNAATGAYFANFNVTGAGSVGTTGSVTSAAIQAYPNGWYRISVVVTATGSIADAQVLAFITALTDARVPSNSSAGTLFAWGAQTEATTANYPGPTSYIPTAAAPVARVADVASMTGTNFSSWYNPLAGTFVPQLTPPPLAQKSLVVEASDANTGTASIFRENSTFNGAGGRYLGVSVVAGSVVSTITTTADSFVFAKVGYAYAANDFALARDGGTPVTGSSGAIVPNADRLAIGLRTFGGNDLWLNGHIAKLPYYPARIPNTPLAALTA